MLRKMGALCLMLMLGSSALAEETFAGKMTVEDTGAFSDEGKTQAKATIRGNGLQSTDRVYRCCV